MTDAIPLPGNYKEYFLTTAAARVIERWPEILLHHQLYDRDKRIVQYNWRGRPAAVFLTEERSPREAGFYKVTVKIYVPSETPSGEKPVIVDLQTDYPARLLPFDLCRTKFLTERLLSNQRLGYQSDRHEEALYLGTNPFATYHTFHFLTRLDNTLRDRLAGVKNVLEIGSGLGLVSFTLAQFLTDARIHGVEIDQVLVNWSGKVKGTLQEVLGYDLSRVSFFEDDVLDLKKVRLQDYDLVIGWFPLSREMDDRQLISVLQELRPGALVCQLFSASPLPLEGGTEHLGFRRLRAGKRLPYNFFERISPAV